MPWKARRACAHKGCPNLAVRGERFCYEHLDEKSARHRRYDRTRPSASRRGYGQEWQEIRDEYMAMHPICERLGCNAHADVVHHIVPKKRGGTDAVSNLMAVCNRCHQLLHRRGKGR
jgi:5-methylcytosine-specific restriction protein A